MSDKNWYLALSEDRTYSNGVIKHVLVKSKSLNYIWDFFRYIYPTRVPEAGCDTRSIFKRGKSGLNTEFSISWTVCLTKA